MKNFRLFKNSKDCYIFAIYFLTVCSILANFSQIVPLQHMYGSFHFGEMIIIMFNDSYTGYFTFPFLLGFMLMTLVPKDQNLYFKIIRYNSRKAYYKEKLIHVLKSLISYMGLIIFFSSLTDIGTANFGLDISDSLYQFSEIYLDGKFETNILILEILKIIILQGLLMYFLSSIHLFLNHFKLSQSIIFIIYTAIIIIMAGMALDFFGEIGEKLSIFSLASSVYANNLSFFTRMIGLLSVNIVLTILNFKMFDKIDIILPKGSKQYQNE